MSKGNQGRRGAMAKKTDSAAPKGSGGKHRRSLSGRGATPKAEERTYHPAFRAKQAKEREQRAEENRRAAAKRRSRVRVSPGNELIVGRNPVMEATLAGIKIERIFVASDPNDGRIRDVLTALANVGAPFVEVTKNDLDVAADGAAHQGIAVEVAEYDYWDLDDLILRAVGTSTTASQVRAGLLVALDHVTDPHNLGAVLRSGAAFGADGVLIPTRRSAGLGVTAWKVSAGAAAKVPVGRVSNLVQALNRCKEAGMFIVGLTGDAEVDLHDFNLYDEPLVLVTGAEGKGLSRLVRETCDVLISIPIDGVESLNAAVATGIALYEVNSQRGAYR